MKKKLMYVGLLTFYLFVSCSKDSVIDEIKNVPVQNPSSISADNEVVQRILKLGFSLNDIKELDDCYLVEGDICFPKKEDAADSIFGLRHSIYSETVTKKAIRVFLVTDLADIPYILSGFLNAINEYNSTCSSIVLQRTLNSSEADIIIEEGYVDDGSLNGAAGAASYPSGSGAPGRKITINFYSALYDNREVRTYQFLVLHELGHTLGFMHTYEQSNIIIPDTIDNTYSESVMRASGITNLPFVLSVDDKYALRYLYPLDVKCAYDLGSTADRVRKLDWNGDGYDDLFFVRPGASTVFLNECNHNGKFFTVLMNNNGIGNFDYGSTGDLETVLDYDGDGKDDIMCYRPGPGLGKVFLLKSNGDKTFTTIFANNNGLSGYDFGSTNDRIVALDYNGDGKDDILCYRPGYNIVYLMRSEGNGTFTVVNNWRSGVAGFNFTYATDKITSLDYNGDGIDEIMCYHPGQKVAYFIKPNGSGGFVLDKSYTNGFCTYDLASPLDLAYALDYDGDGKDDVMLTRPGSKKVYIMKSLSIGNFSLNYSSGNGIIGFDFGGTSDRVVVLDYNNDGKDDIVINRPGSGIAYSAHSNGSTFVRDWPL